MHHRYLREGGDLVRLEGVIVDQPFSAEPLSEKELKPSVLAAQIPTDLLAPSFDAAGKIAEERLQYKKAIGVNILWMSNKDHKRRPLQTCRREESTTQRGPWRHCFLRASQDPTNCQVVTSSRSF